MKKEIKRKGKDMIVPGFGERESLFSLHFHHQSDFIAVHHQRKTGQELTQGRNLEAGADAKAMEGGFLLACYTCLKCSS